MSEVAFTYHRADLFAAVDKLTQLDFEAGQTSPRIFIPHVCNNEGKMGAGFVMPLKKKWPHVETMYKSFCNTGGASPLRRLLGQVQAVDVEPGVTVFNMIAQTLGGARPLSYTSLGRCMEEVYDYWWAHDQSTGIRPEIHAPMFGSALAGGDWNFIRVLISDAWKFCNVHIYFLEGQAPKGFAIDKTGRQLGTNVKLRGDHDEGVIKEILSDTQVKVDFYGDDLNGEERVVDPINYVMV